MTALLAVFMLRVSVLLALALLAAWVSARRPAALRRLILAAATCGALSLPILSALLPAWSLTMPTVQRVPLPPAQQAPTHTVDVETLVITPDTGTRVSESGAGARWPLRQWLVVLWAAGVAAGICSLLTGLVRLRRLSAVSTPVTGGPWVDALARLVDSTPGLRRTRLRHTTGPHLLMTWGMVRPVILIPRDADTWSAERIDVVLLHEAEHIARRDWVLQLAAETLRALAWFNPLAWLAASRLRLECERACDDAVLARGVDASDYADHLVALARTLTRPAPRVPAPAMARTSSLERRVSAMLDPRIVRRPLTRSVRSALTTLGLATTLAVAAVGAQSSFATFSGSVRDPLGGTVPGVTVTATLSTSGAKHEVKSNDRGQFEFVGLVPGTYSVDVSRPGFRPAQDQMQLASGQVLRRDIDIKVGTLEETITVVNSATAQMPGMRSGSPSPTPACTAEPNSGRLTPPLKTVDVRPVYPASMASVATDSRVVMWAVIGIDGAVKELRTIEAASPEFEEAAQEAVRQWRFTQTMLNCVPIEVEMRVSTLFRPQGVMAPPPPPPPPPPTPPAAAPALSTPPAPIPPVPPARIR
jgi:beta-lactamase regulating signal transducer with metallopeptidase domain